MRSPRHVLSLLAAAATVAATAAAAPASDPGVAPARILLGSTAPLTGAAASPAVTRGATAYFRYVNAHGGVRGRAIVYRVVDDASDPVRAAQATARLVEEDGVFAIVSPVGTEQSLATRDYLTAARVPQLFVASGADALAADRRRYPWTIGFQPSNGLEGRIYGAYLARARAATRIGVLYQDDELGRELLAGLRRGIARSKARVVAVKPLLEEGLDAETQVAALKAAGADTLALFAGPAAAAVVYPALARSGWRPAVVAASAARGVGRTPEGTVTSSFLKDPVDTRWGGDAGVELYRSIMSRYAAGANANDLDHVQGMAVAYETVRVLKAAGSEPTRAGVLARTRRLADASNPFLLPGISVRTGATDRIPVEQVLLQRRVGKRWRSFGGLWG